MSKSGCSSSLIKRWYTLGKLAGYPNCCINAFCMREYANKSVFSGTGYTPCDRCLNHSKDFLLYYISLHRDKRLNPFPCDNGLMNLCESVLESHVVEHHLFKQPTSSRMCYTYIFNNTERIDMKVDISYYKAGSRKGQVRKNHVVCSRTDHRRQ